ncbi:MAG: aldehyde dehydrogenase family protein, partial [Bacteroidota bacterium]
PTVLSDVSEDMDVFHQEIFCPVCTVYKFETETEVIEQANATRVGLAAYFYGQNYSLIWRVAEALEFGMVGINTGRISAAQAPFGGIKESGFGREGSKYGLDDFLVKKYLCWGLGH